MIDSCGFAGGRLPWQGMGGRAADFQNSSVAKRADVGSKLPAGPAQATWVAGSNVEVGWSIMAHHGGGYSYRLAPADEPLTEETFRKIPLDFVGPSILRWDGDNTTQLEFNASRVSTGTVPAGSTWAKNPIPTGSDWRRLGLSFDPVCEESEACKTSYAGVGPRFSCRCSGGAGTRGGAPFPNLEIVDVLKIPADLKPGKYVLGWRCVVARLPYTPLPPDAHYTPSLFFTFTPVPTY